LTNDALATENTTHKAVCIHNRRRPKRLHFLIALFKTGCGADELPPFLFGGCCMGLMKKKMTLKGLLDGIIIES
jgi:hypothetical protein